MRRDDLYLMDMIEAADHVAAFIAGVDFEQFQQSELIRSAVVQKLAVIGEAAARVSLPLKSQHPELPWPQMAAFRNILIHAYFGVDWAEVWRVAINRCPLLRQQLAEIVAGQSGGPDEAP